MGGREGAQNEGRDDSRWLLRQRLRQAPGERVPCLPVRLPLMRSHGKKRRIFSRSPLRHQPACLHSCLLHTVCCSQPHRSQGDREREREPVSQAAHTHSCSSFLSLVAHTPQILQTEIRGADVE